MMVPLVAIGLGASCSVPLLTPAQIYQYAIQAGFPDNPPGQGVATQMVAIAMRESAGCPTALNQTPPDNSWGLWQINISPGANPLSVLGLSDPTQLWDPATNAAAAFQIWNGSAANLQIAWGGTPADQAAMQANLPAAQAAALQVAGAGGVDTSGDDSGTQSSSLAASLGISDGALAFGVAALAGLAVWAIAS